MATTERGESNGVSAEQITGLKYLDRIIPLLKRLHDVGCERDRSGNRQLHYDDYCLLVVLYLLNPVLNSMRGLQEASKLEKVQQRLSVPRFSLGSFSEAASVFDSEKLVEVIRELSLEAKPVLKDPRLKDMAQVLTAVDGTLVTALPKMAAASLLKEKTGSGLVKWRLHTHFDIERFVPERIDVTPDGGGPHDERAVLKRTLKPDHCYIKDRGYAKFSLFNDIHNIGSSYVCRLRDNSQYEVAEDRPLTDADRAANVLSDQIVSIGQKRRGRDRPNHPLRLVIVKGSPHTSRGKYRGGSTGVDSDGQLRLATNLLDVPAEIIAVLYQHRWSIEIFFRTLKHMLGCRHLLSHDENGIRIQAYCAIIACLLINILTGRKPTRRTLELLCLHMMGMVSDEELIRHLEDLKRRDEAARKKR
jgi:hypothetical protein